MGALKAYAPRDNKYVEAKNKLVNNVENFYKGREKITEGFKNGVFSKSEDIYYYFFKHCFNFLKPSDLAKKLFEIKDQKKNNDFVEKIKKRWSNLKDRVEKMSGDDKKIKG